MAIVNFSIPKTLERRVGQAIKEKGFASKAEFFRFAALYFMDGLIEKPVVSDEEELDYLVTSIEKQVDRLYRGRKLPGVRACLKTILPAQRLNDNPR